MNDAEWCPKCGHTEHELDVCAQVDVDIEGTLFICRCPLTSDPLIARV